MPPSDSEDYRYRRRVYITPSTIHRARDRYAELAGASDEEIGNLLDRDVRAALAEPGRVECVLDFGQPALVVDVSGGQFGRSTLALLKANRDVADPPLVLVALVTRESGEGARRDGRWTVAPAESGLDDLVQRTLARPGGRSSDLAVESAPRLEGRPAASSTASVPKGLTPTPGSTTTRLISYLQGSSPALVYEELASSEVSARVTTLLASNDVLRESIRVWRRVPFEVRVVVEDDHE